VDNLNVSDLNESVATEQEKMLSQDRVNEIVKREKAAATDKARREMQAEIDALKNQGVGGMAPAVDTDAIYNDVKSRLMQEIDEQKQQQAEQVQRERVQGLVDKFFVGMEKGKEFAPDFDLVTAKFNASAFPQLVTLVASREDLAPIMYELAKNPLKASNLDVLAQRDPEAAMQQLEILGGSIKANMEAEKNNPKVNPPLGHLKPSISAGVDSGDLSLGDLKKIYRG